MADGAGPRGGPRPPANECGSTFGSIRARSPANPVPSEQIASQRGGSPALLARAGLGLRPVGVGRQRCLPPPAVMTIRAEAPTSETGTGSVCGGVYPGGTGTTRGVNPAAHVAPAPPSADGGGHHAWPPAPAPVRRGHHSGWCSLPGRDRCPERHLPASNTVAATRRHDKGGGRRRHRRRPVRLDRLLRLIAALPISPNAEIPARSVAWLRVR